MCGLAVPAEATGLTRKRASTQCTPLYSDAAARSRASAEQESSLALLVGQLVQPHLDVPQHEHQLKAGRHPCRWQQSSKLAGSCSVDDAGWGGGRSTWVCHARGCRCPPSQGATHGAACAPTAGRACRSCSRAHVSHLHDRRLGHGGAACGRPGDGARGHPGSGPGDGGGASAGQAAAAGGPDARLGGDARPAGPAGPGARAGGGWAPAHARCARFPPGDASCARADLPPAGQPGGAASRCPALAAGAASRPPRRWCCAAGESSEAPLAPPPSRQHRRCTCAATRRSGLLPGSPQPRSAGYLQAVHRGCMPAVALGICAHLLSPE